MTDPAATQVYEPDRWCTRCQERHTSRARFGRMRATSLDVAGACIRNIVRATGSGRVPSGRRGYAVFRQHLLEGILSDRPNRYMATNSLRTWFQRIWATDPHDPILSRIRDDLAAPVRAADRGIRDTVITGILEHLFASLQIIKFFLRWANNPGLAGVYKEGARLSAGFRDRRQRWRPKRRLGRPTESTAENRLSVPALGLAAVAP